MGFFSDIFSRSGRVARGQANQGMDKIEDATFEATVKQTVRDMRTELANTIGASAEAMANHNRLEAEYSKYAQQSQDWLARANQALDAGNEDLAKKALAKKAESDQQLASMKTGIDAARNASESLKQHVSDLKRRIDEAERTATTLVARRNAALAQRKVAEALSGAGEATTLSPRSRILKNRFRGRRRRPRRSTSWPPLPGRTRCWRRSSPS